MKSAAVGPNCQLIVAVAAIVRDDDDTIAVV
jgi:hypothetical protein